MKRVIDFTGKYAPKEDEIVTRANIKYLKIEDLKMFDKVVAYERYKNRFKGVKGVSFIKEKVNVSGDNSSGKNK